MGWCHPAGKPQGTDEGCEDKDYVAYYKVRGFPLSGNPLNLLL